MGGCVCTCACAYAVLHGDCYSFLLTAHYYSPLTEKALKSDWAPFSKAEDWRPERVAVADGARRTPAPSLVQLSILHAQDMLTEAAMGAAEIEKRYASAAKRSRLVSVRTAHNIPVASAVPATPVAASPAAAAPPDPVSSIALRPNYPSPSISTLSHMILSFTVSEDHKQERLERRAQCACCAQIARRVDPLVLGEDTHSTIWL